MLISVGLPSTVPGISGELLLDWARMADQGTFESLCVLDVITGPAYDPIVALTGAAAVTQRIRLMTSILVGPLRNPVLLAKQALSLDALSGGRFTLGLAAGYREKDYQACGIDIHQRGKFFDKQLEIISKIWSGQPLEPDLAPVGPAGKPRLILGGGAPAALKRHGRWGEGYISGGLPPETAQANFSLVETAWKEADRPGKPRLINMVYFAFGQDEDARERAIKQLHVHYEDFPQVEKYFMSMLCDTDEATNGAIKANEKVGVDELIFCPLLPELNQLEHLARLVS